FRTVPPRGKGGISPRPIASAPNSPPMASSSKTNPTAAPSGDAREGTHETPSPPPGAERAGVRWGIPERLPRPTSPSQRSALGPSLSPLKGGEGCWVWPDELLRPRGPDRRPPHRRPLFAGGARLRLDLQGIGCV